MRKENIDLRLQCQDVFPQIGVNDVFLRKYLSAVENDSKELDWLTFCPHEFYLKTGIKIEDLYGEAFEESYNIAVDLFNRGELLVGKFNSSRFIVKTILETYKETGLPYIFNKDYANECNPNKHLGVIRSANLCVAPETKILTDVGYLQIDELVDQDVNVWNGEEWSNVRVIKTGESQKLLKVTLSSGNQLECTPYHRWYLQNDYSGKITEKRTHELVSGDRLIKFDLPIIEGEKTLSFPYDNGFFSADGNTYNSLDRIYLYHEKRKLEPFLQSVPNWNYDEKQNRSVGKAIGLKHKFFVPNADYTIKSRLDWLSGFLDGDGTVSRNGLNESIQVASVDKGFLILVQEMLQTLGVHSKVSPSRPEGDYSLPANDGTGGNKEFHCKETFRLLISSTGLYKLSILGFKTNRLRWEVKSPQRNSERFITVLKVEDENRYDDTYCFTEFKRNMGMFNGILTGQCVESFSNIEENMAHVCSLYSVNLANCKTLDDIEAATKYSVKALNRTVELSSSPIEDTRRHNDYYRIIGVGVLGYHDYLVSNGMNYTNSEKVAYSIAEMIAYWAIEQSVDDVSEYGVAPAFENSDWHKGIFFGRSVYDNFTETESMKEKWIKLYEDKVSKIGMANTGLIAIAPNTSTSQLCNSSASILPVFKKYFIEKNKLMSVPFVAKFLNDDTLWLYQESVNINPEKTIAIAQNFQQWVDQGISLEFVLNSNIYNSALDLRDWWIKALVGDFKNKRSKTLYYLRPFEKSDITTCTSCAN